MNEKVVSSYIPDDFSSEETRVNKIFGNLISCIILIALTGVVVYFSAKLMTFLNNDNIIPKIVFEPSQILKYFDNLTDADSLALMNILKMIPGFLRIPLLFCLFYSLVIGESFVCIIVLIITIKIFSTVDIVEVHHYY